MNYMLGVDEAGRGAWAGPMTVGAVILGDWLLPELTDSKLLSKVSRQRLAELIYKNAVSATVGWVNADEIDRLGLTAATSLGVRRALADISYEGCEIIIDGHINYFPEYNLSKCLIKADQIIPAVSAASIIAKVARDEYMAKMAIEYPGYGFDSHVGYGTKNHRHALEKLGITKLHRITYKPLLNYGEA